MNAATKLFTFFLTCGTAVGCGASVDEASDASWFVGNWYRQPGLNCPGAACRAIQISTLEVESSGRLTERLDIFCFPDESNYEVEARWAEGEDDNGAVVLHDESIRNPALLPLGRFDVVFERVSDCELQLREPDSALDGHRWFRGTLRFGEQEQGCDPLVHPESDEAIDCWEELESGFAEI